MSPTPRAPPGAKAPARGGTMHPGMLYWWKTHRGGGSCAAYADCGPPHREAHGWRGRWHEYAAAGHDSELGAGAFGVRRPLRYLAYKLELDEPQVAALARILNELKTE